MDAQRALARADRLWLCHGYSNPQDSPLDLLYFGLTALFWIGHRLSSTWLAYFTEAYRPLLRSQPVRFVVIPLFVTAGCFAVFLPPDAALPWSRQERLVALAIIDYIFVTYHFAAQHFGALALYRSRIGRSGCPSTRKMDRLFALGVGGALVFLADILAGAVAYQDQWVDRWFFPAFWSRRRTRSEPAPRAVARRDSGHAFVELRSPRWSLPRVLYVLGIAAMVALALRPRSLFLFLVIWTSQHWILATGLASQTPTAEPAPGRGLARRMLHALNTRPWAILVLLGWCRSRSCRSSKSKRTGRMEPFTGIGSSARSRKGCAPPHGSRRCSHSGSPPGLSTISSTVEFIECPTLRSARRRKAFWREPAKDERETTIFLPKEIYDQTKRLIALYKRSFLSIWAIELLKVYATR